MQSLQGARASQCHFAHSRCLSRASRVIGAHRATCKPSVILLSDETELGRARAAGRAWVASPPLPAPPLPLSTLVSTASAATHPPPAPIPVSCTQVAPRLPRPRPPRPLSLTRPCRTSCPCSRCSPSACSCRVGQAAGGGRGGRLGRRGNRGSADSCQCTKVITRRGEGFGIVPCTSAGAATAVCVCHTTAPQTRRSSPLPRHDQDVAPVRAALHRNGGGGDGLAPQTHGHW